MSGPNIIVRGSAQEATALAEQLGVVAKHVEAMVNSPGWEWFSAQCEAKARVLEERVVNVTTKLDPRDEDRHRGEIAAYRGMVRLVHTAAVAHARASEKAAKAQAKAARQEQAP